MKQIIQDLKKGNTILEEVNETIIFKALAHKNEYVKKIQESEKHQEGAVILKCEEDIGNYFKNSETDVQG